MTAQEFYRKETGNEIPDNQISYSEWYIDYVMWLEQKVKNNLVLDDSSKYIVFEYKNGELVQLSTPLPTLEKARKYVEGWKSKKLYIYKLIVS